MQLDNDPELTQEEFILFRDYLHEKSGIYFADSRGEELPPGVYFIRYCAGNHRFSKKATLLR